MQKTLSGQEVFYVGDAVQGREHSLQWSRTRSWKKSSKENADPDAQLVERLKRRDQHAFLDLYYRHRRSVYRFLMHMTGSLAIAEDLTQEVFVVVLDGMCSGAIAQFDPSKGTLE